MTGRTSVTRLLASAALAAMLAASEAGACAYHGSPALRLDAGYPGSMSVALAVGAARRDGLLPTGEIGPAMRRLFGYGRAARDLRAVQASLGEAGGGATVGFSVLLVEAGLWAWLDTGRGPARIHLAGPEPAAPVVLMAEAALDPLLAGNLGVDEALRRGLVRIVDDPQDRVAPLLVAALSRENRLAAR